MKALKHDWCGLPFWQSESPPPPSPSHTHSPSIRRKILDPHLNPAPASAPTGKMRLGNTCITCNLKMNIYFITMGHLKQMVLLTCLTCFFPRIYRVLFLVVCRNFIKGTLMFPKSEQACSVVRSSIFVMTCILHLLSWLKTNYWIVPTILFLWLLACIGQGASVGIFKHINIFYNNISWFIYFTCHFRKELFNKIHPRRPELGFFTIDQ